MKNLSAFTPNGKPIRGLADKLDALNYCIAHDSDEDIMGHCADLFEFYRLRVNEALKKQGSKPMSRLQAFKHYVGDAGTITLSPLEQLAREGQSPE